MSKAQSLWSKADKFLSLSRKIIINLVTAVVLVVVTFSIIGGISSAFSKEEGVSAQDKILWFKLLELSSINHQIHRLLSTLLLLAR